MKKRFAKLLSTFLVLLLALLLAAGCAATTTAETSPTPVTSASAAAEPTATPEPVELLVSAAASLTDVMQAIAEEYKKVNGYVTITYTFGSSGALQTQIEEGAPADLFFSAGKKQMKALDEAGLLLEGTNTEMLENKVVLIVPKGSTKGITSFADAATDKVSSIALGEPTGVPVGQYSEQVFTSLGILDAVKAKANYGSDVRQVLTWVEGGEIDCGVVYSTDAKTSDAVEVVAEAPEGSSDKIIYPAAVIVATKHAEEAKAFLEFLKSDTAMALFAEAGFSPLS